MASPRSIALALCLGVPLAACAAGAPKESSAPPPAESSRPPADPVLPPLASGRPPDVIFWATQPHVVQKMLEVAAVTKDDVVYDLGSGDGRILIAAAKKYGARGVGYEIDEKLVEESRRSAKEQGVDHLVKFEAKDIFTVDLTPATVVTLYILPGMAQRLIPQLKKLKAGTRIVSHNFPIPGVEPDETFNADEPDRPHAVLFFRTPLRAAAK